MPTTRILDVSVKFKAKPFQTPNFVLVEPPPKLNERGYPTGQGDDDISLPLHALDIETLSLLCEEFRKEIFTKANKPLPDVIRKATP